MIAPGRYSAGDVVGFDMHLAGVGRIVHVGILSDARGRDGLPTVVHSSKLYKCVLETTMPAFAANALTPIRSLGYPGTLRPELVVARARSRIGQAWSPLQNCEHFATWCHGLAPTSPQLRALLTPR